jgi:hypothetical protein
MGKGTGPEPDPKQVVAEERAKRAAIERQVRAVQQANAIAARVKDGSVGFNWLGS